MCEWLKDESFHVKVKKYIHANLHAYLPGLEDYESVQAIPRIKDIVYSCPVHPDSSKYHHQLQDFELKLTHVKQVHTCHSHQCLVMDNHGNMRCKCRVPFPCIQMILWMKRVIGDRRDCMDI